MYADVVVVGGGITGCSAALLFAAEGLQVAMIEKKTKNDNYKRLCTHFIQPSALPVIRRMRLDHLIEQAGGLPNKADIWTSAGWIKSDKPYSSDGNSSHGYNIERRILDPLLRKEVCRQPGIRYFPGTECRGVVGAPPYTGGIHELLCTDASGTEGRFQARLIVAADGRFSGLADMIGNKGEISSNKRFACFAYFKDLPLKSGSHSQFWMLNPNMAFAYPLCDDRTLICLFIKRTEWDEWKGDLENKILSFVRGLPDGPEIDKASRVSAIYRMMDMPNISREVVKDGIAFAGDAALSLDPMSGVGCGFAFQSAEWLVDHTAKALLENRGLDQALENYEAFHRRQLAPHAAGIIAESLAEPDETRKAALYAEVVNDPELTESFLALTGRLITPQQFQAVYLKNFLYKKKQHEI